MQPLTSGESSYLTQASQLSSLGFGQGSTYASSSGQFPGMGIDGYAPSAYGAPNAFGQGGIAEFGGAGLGQSQNGLMGYLGNLLQQLGSVLGQLGINTSGGQAGSPIADVSGPPSGVGANPDTQNVANATFSSWGDPHLGETGTLNGQNGTSSNVNSHFDSMSSQSDLLSSNDFRGGFRISTTATAPTANGVTHNQSATIDLDHGRDTVSMNNTGAISIEQNGNAISISNGQTVALDNGDQITENQNGSLTVNVANDHGGSIATTLTSEGGGVDVSANVQNATVGGAIANEAGGNLPTGPNAWSGSGPSNSAWNGTTTTPTWVSELNALNDETSSYA